MWKLLAPGVGLGDLLTPENGFSHCNYQQIVIILKYFPYDEQNDTRSSNSIYMDRAINLDVIFS